MGSNDIAYSFSGRRTQCMCHPAFCTLGPRADVYLQFQSAMTPGRMTLSRRLHGSLLPSSHPFSLHPSTIRITAKCSILAALRTQPVHLPRRPARQPAASVLSHNATHLHTSQAGTGTGVRTALPTLATQLPATHRRRAPPPCIRGDEGRVRGRPVEATELRRSDARSLRHDEVDQKDPSRISTNRQRGYE